MDGKYRWLMACGLVLGMLSGLVGCKPSDAVKQSQVIGKGSDEKPPTMPATAPLDQATLGMVSGTIRFAGKAPERVKIDMSMDPVCSMMGGDNYSEQYVVKDGKLANVYVYIKGGPAAAMMSGGPVPAPVVMDQVGCKYVPHVVAVVRGGSVEFRNSDGTMHNIHTMPAGNLPIDISQGAKGAPQVRPAGKCECPIQPITGSTPISPEAAMPEGVTFGSRVGAVMGGSASRSSAVQVLRMRPIGEVR